MTPKEKQVFVREKCRLSVAGSKAKVLWSAHSASRLIQTIWTREDVERALAESEIVEDYPITRRALPDCLVLGFIHGKEPIHAVVALDISLDRVLIVTVYGPDPRRWEDDWCKRRG